MSKFCKYCGAELPDEASFCPVCAADQVVKAEVEIPKPRKKRKFAAIITGAAVVIAAAGLWAVFNTVPESPEPAVSEAVVKEVETSPEPTAEEAPEPSPAETVVPSPSPVEESEQLPSPEPSPIAEVVPSPTPVAEEPEEAPAINDSAVNTAEPENSLWYTKSPGPRREFSGSAAALKGDTWYFKFYETEESDTPLAGILATDNSSVISLTQNDYGEWDAVMEAAGTATLTYISDSDGEMYSMDVTVVDQTQPFDPEPPAVVPSESQNLSGSTYHLTFDKFTVPVGGNFGTGAEGPNRIGVYKDGVRITDFSCTIEDPEACELYIDSEGYLMLTNVLGGEYQLTITVGGDVLNFMWVGGPRRDEGAGYDSGIALGFLNFHVTPGSTFGGRGSATYYADVIFNNMRITDYTVEVADTSVCTIEVDGNGRMIIHNANDIDGDTTDVKVNVGDKKAVFTWVG